MGRLTVKEALASATEDLQRAAVTTTPLLEAEVLLASALKKQRADLWANPERELSDFEHHTFQNFVSRRRKYEPVAYIVEKKEFFGLPLLVSRDTLIPRPETETLVEEILLDFENAEGALEGLDVGTGTGAIAVALAAHLSRLHMTALDVSLRALSVCSRNIKNLALQERVTTTQSDLLGALPVRQRFHFVACNLPYLSEKRLAAAAPDLQYEPRQALVAPENGLGLYARLLPQLPMHLAPRSMVYFEAEPEQIPDLTTRIRAIFPKAEVSIFADLAHATRFLKFRPWHDSRK